MNMFISSSAFRVGRRIARGVAVTVSAVGLVVGSVSAAHGAVSTAPAGSLGAQEVGLSTMSVGNDVSWPQCVDSESPGSGPLPTGPEFAIVGVTGGTAANVNNCFAAQLQWAKNSTKGGSGQPAVALYVNTGNPGKVSVRWPKSNNDLTGKLVNNPYGGCSGGEDPACAFMYGWQRAQHDFDVSGLSNPQDYLWWLDYEINNSWSFDKDGGPTSANDYKSNVASLEGMVSYFKGRKAAVGLYVSTPFQWTHNFGDYVKSDSVLAGLPNWFTIADGGGLDLAKEKCRTFTPATPGSVVSMVQWIGTQNNHDFDFDYSCTPGMYSVASAAVATPAWLAPCDDIASGACGPAGRKVTALRGNASVTWTGVHADKPGNYTVTVSYSNGWSSPLDAKVSAGRASQTAHFAPVAGAASPKKAVGTQDIVLPLTAGDNTITITPTTSGDAPEIVSITVRSRVG